MGEAIKDNNSDFIKISLEKAVNGIFEIRQTQLEEAAETIRASFATVAAEFGITKQNFPNHTSFITGEKLQSNFNQGWLMYGVYDNKRIVGYVSLSNENGNVYKLHNLAVLPEYRHKGYGKQLLNFCKTKAAELGGNKIKIDIIEENFVLKSWYIDNGFIHIGTITVENLPFTVGMLEWEKGINI